MDKSTGVTNAEIQSAYVVPPIPLNQPILLVEYDANWPRLFEQVAARIGAALGQRALSIEHVGSTSVPGLAAKPIIDVLLVVANSATETDYAPSLEAEGYVLHVREPDWYEHRMFKGTPPSVNLPVNLHVFSQGCAEIERMLRFRDWLRLHPDDRRFYEQTKRVLARQSWQYVQNYADAKSAVIAEIIARLQSSNAA